LKNKINENIQELKNKNLEIINLNDEILKLKNLNDDNNILIKNLNIGNFLLF
jgi:hypothetical protein